MANPLQPIAQAPTPSSTAANTYSDVNALAALKKDPTSPQAIKAVAQQVDALFLQMMLKSMRDASAEVGEPTSNEMGMYQDMFDKQIALQLSQHQSLGLGAQLTRQLAAQAAAKANKSSDPQASAGTATSVPALKPLPRPAGSAPPSSDTAPAATTPNTSATGAIATSPSHFVSQIYPAIRRAASALGVSPLGMLAQAALETGWGQRMARTVAGSPSLNMFGIKADGNWGGTRATAETVEFSGGVATQRRTAFRAYDSIEASVNDFAGLLTSSPRYREAVASGGNVQDYVSAIGRSGYATDPKYTDKLNEILNSSTFRDALKKGVISL